MRVGTSVREGRTRGFLVGRRQESHRYADRMLAMSMLAVTCGAVLIGALLGRGQVLIPVGLVGLALATWFAYRAPSAAGLTVLSLLGGLTVFQMVPGFNSNITMLGGGVRLEDVLMVGMLLAMLLRVLRPNGRHLLGRLLVPAMCLGIWLATAVLRNAGGFGLSALGEFRYRYLVLVVPLCLMVSIGSRQQAQRALRWFALIAVALPILAMPALLVMKGYTIGPAHRVLPAQVSLGLLVGLMVLWRCRALMRWPRSILWLVTVFGALEILADANRSVWLAGIVMGLVLLALDRDTRRAFGFALGVGAVGAMASVAAGALGLDALSILSEQGGAAIAVQGTALWRWNLWKASLVPFAQSPIAGRGFGLYWNTYVPEMGVTVTVFPHDLYIMTLAILGAVGLGLLVWLGVAAWVQLRKGARALAHSEPAWADVSSVGVATLVGLAAYGVAYSFDPYTLTLLGICLAVAVHESAFVTVKDGEA